ncbi:hypothetical protein F4814DRAFT_415644 [Daldinia grandis]|nr:hypothetical protein F4814DRAFT_415644 [Daldinia grandis]
MASITFAVLAHNESEWVKACHQLGILDPYTASIHHAEYAKDSASKMANLNQLLTRSLWNETIYVGPGIYKTFHKVVTEMILDQARSLLKNSPCWNMAVQWIRDTPTKSLAHPDAIMLGPFSQFIKSQRRTLGLSGDDDTYDKVTYTPIAKRTRSYTAPSHRPQTPATPTPLPKVEEVTERLDAMDIDEEMDEDMSPSILSPFHGDSPITAEESKQTKPLKNEQEVVFCLVLFKRAITMIFEETQKADWAPDQNEFKVKNAKDEKIFNARVDASLTVLPYANIRQICETKKSHRGTNRAKVQAQESAQVSAWVADQPPRDLAKMRRDNGVARRVSYSQCKDEIYVKISEFTADYVDYICDRPAKPAFITHEEIGPFKISNWRALTILAEFILACTIVECGRESLEPQWS